MIIYADSLEKKLFVMYDMQLKTAVTMGQWQCVVKQWIKMQDYGNKFFVNTVRIVTPVSDD